MLEVAEEASFSKSLDCRVDRALDECLERAADVRRETAGEGGAGREEVKDSRCEADREEVETVRVEIGDGPREVRGCWLCNGVFGVGVIGEETESAPLREVERVGVASPSSVGRCTTFSGLEGVRFCIDCDSRLALVLNSCEPSSGGVRKAELGEGNGEPEGGRSTDSVVR